MTTTYKAIVQNVVTNQTLDIGPVIKKVHVKTEGITSTVKIIIDDSGAAAHQAAVTNGSKITLSITDPDVDGGSEKILMKGYIEDIKPEISNQTAVVDRTAVIEVNGSANYLEGLLLTKLESFIGAVRIGDVFSRPLRYLGSEYSVPQEDQTPKDSLCDTLVDNLEKKSKSVPDLYYEASEKADIYFVANWNTNHIILRRNTDRISTGKTLILNDNPSSSNVLNVEPFSRISSSIRNHVTVVGGALFDHFTEGTASKLRPGLNTTILPSTDTRVTLQNDSALFVVGQQSIRAVCNNAPWKVDHSTPSTAGGEVEGLWNTPSIIFNFSPSDPLFNNTILDFTGTPQANCTIFLGGTGNFRLEIIDDAGHRLLWRGNPVDIEGTIWKRLDFILGYNAPLPDSVPILGGTKTCWRAPNGNVFDNNVEKLFNWRISKIIVKYAPYYIPDGIAQDNFSGSFYVDGLSIPGTDVVAISAVAEDVDGQQRYLKRMVEINRSDLHSFDALQQVANEELMLRKDPFQKLRLPIKFDPDFMFTGLTVNVYIMNYDVGTLSNPVVYDIVSIEQILSDDEDLYRGHDKVTWLELIRADAKVSISRVLQSQNPLGAARRSDVTRIEALEARDGASVVSVGGSGGGGSGEVDWFNVPYARVHGNVYLGGWAGEIEDTKQFLEIRSNPYEFKTWDNGVIGDIIAFLRQEDSIGHNYNIPDSASIRFTSLKPSTVDGSYPFTHLSQVNFGVEGVNAGIACSHHLVVRKDFILNGMLQCIEGAFVLHGGKYRQWTDALTGQSVPMPPTIYSGGMQADAYNMIAFRNMMNGFYIPIRPGRIIDRKGSTGQPGQVLTRVAANDTLSQDAYYGFGGLEWADGGGGNAGPYHPHDQSLNTVDATRFRNLTIETTNGAAVDGTGQTGNLTTWGSINCHGTVATSHLRSAAATQGNNVMMWSNFLPVNDQGTQGASGRFLGNNQYYWTSIHGANMYTDNLYSIGTYGVNMRTALNLGETLRDFLGRAGSIGEVLTINSAGRPAWQSPTGDAGPYHPHNQSLNTVDAVKFRNLTLETVNGAAVDGTGATGNLTTWGSINCHGTVATSHLRSATASTSNNVMMWSHLLPVNDQGTQGASGRFLGNSQYFWSAIYGGTLFIDEIRMLPASTFGGIRINSPIRDPNGSRGTAGQVFTSRGPNDAPTWQNPQGSTSPTGQRIEHGQVQTNAVGDDVIVNFSPAFQTQPHITTGMLDSTGRPLNVTITSLIGQSQNDLRAGFRIRATTLMLENGNHNHDNGARFVYAQKPSDNPDPYNNPSNVPNHKHFYSDWYFEQVNGYDMQQGVYIRGNTGNTNITTNFARPAETTIHWIAIGT